MRDKEKFIQARLNMLGHKLVIDGDIGPKTKYALQKEGMAGTVEEILHKILPYYKEKHELPWMDLGRRLIGIHEKTDNKFLRKWMASDGSTVGDPANNPWCGDFVETCIKLSLPNEPVPENPYLAYNWLKWGKATTPKEGAIMVFWRGAKQSWKGHIGFYLGETVRTYRIMGGNQNNQVSIASYSKLKLRPGGCRWPVTA